MPLYQDMLIVGDSILEGCSPYLVNEIRALPIPVRGWMISSVGASVRTWLEDTALSEMLRERKYTFALIMLGTNVGELNAHIYASLCQEMVRRVRSMGCMFIVFIGPFTYDAHARKRTAVLKELLKGACPVDGGELAQGLPRAGENQVHFTRAGYKTLAERIILMIRPVLVSSAPATMAAAGGSLFFTALGLPWMHLDVFK